MSRSAHRLLITLVFAAAALAAAPALASADAFCVQNGPSPAVKCPASFDPTHQFTTLNGAATSLLLFNGDSVMIEPGTYAEYVKFGAINRDQKNVTFFGDPAQPRPVITSLGAAGGPDVTFDGRATVAAESTNGVTLRHLEIDQTTPVATANNPAAYAVGGATLDDVVINSTADCLIGGGLTLINVKATQTGPGGGSCIFSDLSGPGSPVVSIRGLSVDAPNAIRGVFILGVPAATVNIDGASVIARGTSTFVSAAVTINAAAVTIAHLKASGGQAGLFALSATGTVSDSTLSAVGPPLPLGGAVTAPSAGLALGGSSLAVRNVTAVASDPSSAGIEAIGSAGPGPQLAASTVTVTNSIARGQLDDLLAGPPIQCTGTCTPGHIDASFDNYRPRPGDGVTVGTANQSGDPLFVSGIPGAGEDFHVTAGSPVIDAGIAAPAGDSDLAGNLRPDSAGTAPDLGAYESTFTTGAEAPVCPALSTTTGGSVPVHVSLSCSSSPGLTNTYAIVASPSHGSLSGLDAAAGGVIYTPAAGYSGTDSFIYRASNPAGLSNPATVTITTRPTPPTLTGARQSHTIWTEGNALAHFAGKHRPPIGTTFSFTLNETARVTLVFTQQVTGRKLKGACVAPTKQHHKPACQRTVTRGMIWFTPHSGQDKVSFQGRISRSYKLKPGRYTLTITALNTAGQRSRPQVLRFTIVK